MGTERREDTLNQVTERAIYLLEHPGQVEPLVRGRQAIRLWHYPAFDAYRTLAIFWPRSEQEPWMVREVTWDRPHDAGRLRDPMRGIRYGFHANPAIRVRDGSVPQPDLEQRLGVGRAIPIPVLAACSGVGIDGVNSGLELSYGLDDVRLAWWGEGPEEWVAFIAWADELWAFLEDYLG